MLTEGKRPTSVALTRSTARALTRASRCQLWLASNTAVKLFAMFADNEAPRVRSQIKQCASQVLICSANQRLTPVRVPHSCHSKLFLEALPALRVSGRLRQEDNKVRRRAGHMLRCRGVVRPLPAAAQPVLTCVVLRAVRFYR